MKKIVVIGGTGHFGGRICRRLAGQANAELVVASRDRAKAQIVVDGLLITHPDSPICAASLDHRSAVFSAELQSLNPDIVIHTAGPFQGQSYRVAQACIEFGSHYIDLADGREFVEGFDSLDAAAKRGNVLLVSGASTLPGLSSVVIDSLREGFDSVQEIQLSIAPAHQTPRGRGTIAAVLSYCGKPFEVLVGGRTVTKYGWQDLTMQHYPSFGARLSGACDVPDLGLLPNYVEGLQSVTFHAALESRWEQIALWLMAWVTRAGLVRNWEKWVPTFQRISDRLINYGSDVGGMQVTITGQNIDGQPRSVTWNLTAQQNHGPEIPGCPALILARKLVADEISLTGAVPCLGLFSMSDFENEVSDLDIHWEIEGSD